jgi:RNA polymerase sigma factor (sigma-70 family)
MVLLAREGWVESSREALAKLCNMYWYPLYAFIRRRGYSPEEAQDLTQGFFARLLERGYLRQYDKERGRFRSFLLASLNHFLSNERDWANAEKRGGGTSPVSLDAIIQIGEKRYSLEPRSDLTPENIFEREWALTLVEQVCLRVQTEFAQAGQESEFERLKTCFIRDEAHIPYRELAVELGTSEGALRVAIHRLRRRFREVFHEEIAHTVSSASEVQEELQYLMTVISGSG